MTTSPRISPFLWYDGQSQEAAKFYVSVFPGSRVLSVSKLETGPAEGNAFVEFEIGGQRFSAVDGGPMYKFTPAISFVIPCDTQEEIDHYWNSLSEGGVTSQCGWLEDKFGLSWQVVPAMLGELMERNSKAVMGALLTMEKIDLAELRRAAEEPVRSLSCQRAGNRRKP